MNVTKYGDNFSTCYMGKNNAVYTAVSLVSFKDIVQWNNTI